MIEHKLISGDGFSTDHREAHCDNCSWDGCLCNTTIGLITEDFPPEYTHKGKSSTCPNCSSKAVVIGEIIDPGF